MDNLTRRMLDDINLSKTVFPNLSTANKAANDLLKMNAFANTQGLLPHLNSLKIISGSILADQGLISDAIAAQKMLSSLTATKGLVHGGSSPRVV